MNCGDAVESLEKRVMYESLGEILAARTRLAKVIGRSQADIVYKKAVQKNEVLLKAAASKFEEGDGNFCSNCTVWMVRKTQGRTYAQSNKYLGRQGERPFHEACCGGHASERHTTKPATGVQCLQGKQIHGVELFRISLKN